MQATGLILPFLSIGLAFAQTEAPKGYIEHVQDALGLKPGAVVADIGTGDELQHPLHISRAIGREGKIICVDIKESALEKLARAAKENGLANLETRVGKPDDPMLPEASVDAVLISFAYHEFTAAPAMLARVRRALRSAGRLVIIESISDKNRQLSRDGQAKDHQLAPEILIAELEAAGFETPGGTETLVQSDGVLRYLVAGRAAR